jgi:hypothetical protein
MTIGIGVLCCTKPKNPKFKPTDNEGIRPDAIVMVADTMGSTDYDSTDDLHKMFVYPKEQLYGTCAGRVETCGEIIYAVKSAFAELQGPRTHGTILTLLNTIVNGHRAQHFQLDVLQTNFLPVNPTPQWQHEKIEQAYRDYDTNAHLLIGTFDERGQALLYFVGETQDQPGLVHPRFFPGFHCIGIGARNANFWLRYRGQALGLNPKQSVYHAYEAKVMAANAPTVNDSTEVVMVSSGQEPFYFSEKIEAPKDSPVSLPELESMFRKYGPQDTRKDLGHPLPKTRKGPPHR